MEDQREDDAVRRLLDFAGPRSEMPEEAKARLEEVSRSVWRAKVEAHASARRRRRQRRLALAALLLLSAGLGLWFGRWRNVATSPVRPVATVERLYGLADVLEPGARRLASGDEVRRATVVRTGSSGRLALRLAGGGSIRLDVATEVRFETESALTLRRGAVYFDSGEGLGGSSIEVRTPWGVARDIGTQFEVRLLAEALRLQVREGDVELEAGGTRHQAGAGTSLTLHRDGTVEQGALLRHASSWDWVARTSPRFELEGRTIREFLDWVARETGLELAFADAELKEAVAKNIAHGSVAGLLPEQMLGVVLPSAGLEFRIEEGILLIE